MKNIFLLFSAITLTFTLSACGSNNKPMTEVDMAKKYNLTIEEYEQAKSDAAAMNMTMEQHLGEGHHTPEHAEHH